MISARLFPRSSTYINLIRGYATAKKAPAYTTVIKKNPATASNVKENKDTVKATQVKATQVKETHESDLAAKNTVNNALQLDKTEQFKSKAPAPADGGLNSNITQNVRSAQLDVVMGVAGDEQAALMCELLSVDQNIRVLSGLAQKKARSPVVLRTISQSIISNTVPLSMKACADVYYSMRVLNYDNEILLPKVGEHVIKQLGKRSDNKVAAVGSIITSLGILRYRDPNLLNALSGWIVERHHLWRKKDLVSLLFTLALVDFPSDHADKIRSVIVPQISEADMSRGEWLNFVWILSVLGLKETSHLESVLNPEFSAALAKDSATQKINPAQRMKMLNINATAKHLTENYTGPLVDPSLFDVPFDYRKSKQPLVDALLDTTRNLFSSESDIRQKFNTEMGFVIDVECVLNEKRLPLAVDQTHENASRIAMMVYDYFDLCRGDNAPNGFNAIAIRLLEKRGYKVLPVPHMHFNNTNNVVHRVRYLDDKLKNITKNK